MLFLDHHTMSRFLFISGLMLCMVGCSTINSHQSKPSDAVIQAEEEAFYIPKSIKAVGVDPMETVYNYSKSDIIASIFFNFDIARPREEYFDRVEMASKFFIQNKDLNILVVGHCDHFGEQSYNNTLGLKRAENIKNMLIERGIEEDRIIVASVGSEQAKEMSTNKEETMIDRRVDIVLFENNK